MTKIKTEPTAELMTAAEIAAALGELGGKLAQLKRMTRYDDNLAQLREVRQQLKDDKLWDDPDNARRLGQQEARLQERVALVDGLDSQLREARELFALLQEEGELDDDNRTAIADDLSKMRQELQRLELEAMFSDNNDPANAFVEIQAGQGGTEAQDWAEMMLRMYLKWSDGHKFRSEVLEVSAGEVAGIKSANIHIKGAKAYGWLRTESGIHRLVRKSPFNANNKRHTSFASVFVTPEVAADIEVNINPKDLRIDTYRASGAGGQHVNKTDSAVRITHLPTGVVVQCQSQRSQHQNREQAMKQLRSKLYLLEEEKKNRERLKLEDAKDEISWGRQIRSYVLDDARIKDLRTGVEKSDCLRVLDGDLDDFIIASLQLQARQGGTE